jgi:hypothetical protein
MFQGEGNWFSCEHSGGLSCGGNSSTTHLDLMLGESAIVKSGLGSLVSTGAKRTPKWTPNGVSKMHFHDSLARVSG